MRLHKRLNPDRTPKPWCKPINRVDEAAYHHDLRYDKHEDAKTRNEMCDKDMVKKLDGIYNPLVRERIDRGIVRKIISSKVKLSMGKKKAHMDRHGPTSWTRAEAGGKVLEEGGQLAPYPPTRGSVGAL